MFASTLSGLLFVVNKMDFLVATTTGCDVCDAANGLRIDFGSIMAYSPAGSLSVSVFRGVRGRLVSVRLQLT